MSASPVPDLSPTPVSTAPSWSLDELSQLGSADLEAVFAAGTAGASDLSRLSGHPRGQVLAAPLLHRPRLARGVRWLAGTPLILWEGKSFQSAVDPARGRGANRAVVGQRLAVFPFTTAFAPSIVDGGPCVAISYDVPRNPRVMRPIYDELRCVAPALYLGRGTYRRHRRGARLMLWFAVDTARQDRPMALPALRRR